MKLHQIELILIFDIIFDQHCRYIFFFFPIIQYWDIEMENKIQLFGTFFNYLIKVTL